MERKTPMDTSAIFEVASISKQFTAMIIMMLEEQGRLSYDDSVHQLLLRIYRTGESAFVICLPTHQVYQTTRPSWTSTGINRKLPAMKIISNT